MAGDIFGGEGMTIGMVAGLPVEELTRRIAVALRAGEACQRALAFYLHELESRRLHQALGYPSTVHFAVNRLQLSRGQARDLLRAGRRLEELPALDAAFARGELSWSKVRVIARVATADTEARWIERCRDLTAEQVEGLASSVREGDGPPSLERGLPQAWFALRFRLNRLERELYEQARAKLAAELGRVLADDEVLSELVRMLLGTDADGSVPGRKAVDGALFRVVLQAVGEQAGNAAASSGRGAVPAGGPGHAPARPESEPVVVSQELAATLRGDDALPWQTRRRILRRDGHRCRHCGTPRGVAVHHVVFRSHGGGDEDGNLLMLCARCHGLVHEGFVKVSFDTDHQPMVTDRNGRGLCTPLVPHEVVVAADRTPPASADARVPRAEPPPNAAALANERNEVLESLDHSGCPRWSMPPGGCATSTASTPTSVSSARRGGSERIERGSGVGAGRTVVAKRKRRGCRARGRLSWSTTASVRRRAARGARARCAPSATSATTGWPIAASFDLENPEPRRGPAQ